MNKRCQNWKAKLQCNQDVMDLFNLHITCTIVNKSPFEYMPVFLRFFVAFKTKKQQVCPLVQRTLKFQPL